MNLAQHPIKTKSALVNLYRIGLAQNCPIIQPNSGTMFTNATSEVQWVTTALHVSAACERCM
jgi:hypothetical protein